MGNDPTLTNKPPGAKPEQGPKEVATGLDLSRSTFSGFDMMDQPAAAHAPMTRESFSSKWSKGRSFPDTGTTVSIEIRKGAKAA